MQPLPSSLEASCRRPEFLLIQHYRAFMPLFFLLHGGCVDIEEKYKIFMAGVAEQCRAFHELHQTAMRCRPRCSACCRSFSLLPLEMAAVCQAVLDLDEAARDLVKRQVVQEQDACPLLVDGLCVIYASRPLICRTQGFPLGYIDHERAVIELSVCPMSFDEQHPFERESLLYMDPLNEELARLNEQYVSEKQLPPGSRSQIRETLGLLLKL